MGKYPKFVEMTEIVVPGRVNYSLRSLTLPCLHEKKIGGRWKRERFAFAATASETVSLLYVTDTTSTKIARILHFLFDEDDKR